MALAEMLRLAVSRLIVPGKDHALRISYCAAPSRERRGS